MFSCNLSYIITVGVYNLYDKYPAAIVKRPLDVVSCCGSRCIYHVSIFNSSRPAVATFVNFSDFFSDEVVLRKVTFLISVF